MVCSQVMSPQSLRETPVGPQGESPFVTIAVPMAMAAASGAGVLPVPPLEGPMPTRRLLKNPRAIQWDFFIKGSWTL